MLPLTANQQALWWLRGFAPDSAAYHPTWAVRLDGVLPPDRVRRSLAALIQRHPMAGLLIITGQDGSAQQGPGMGVAAVEVLEAKGWDEARWAKHLRETITRPFDLDREPPIRATVLQDGSRSTVLVICMHHIAMDGRSTDVIMEDLGTLIAADGDAAAAGLDAPVTDYARHVRAEARYLASPSAQTDWQYWQQQLALPLPTLDLRCADRRQRPIRRFRGRSVTVDVGQDLTARLRALAAEALTTPFTLLLASWQAFLHRVSGQDDLVVGTPYFGSDRVRNAVGYYTNMLPIRSALDADLRFSDLLTQVRASVADALTHAEFPFAVTVERLGGLRDPSITPVFQAVFAFQQTRPGSIARRLMTWDDQSPGLMWGGLPTVPIRVPDQGAGQFDIALDLADLGDRLHGDIKVDADRFDHETAEALSKAYICFLAAAMAAPNTALGDLPLSKGPAAAPSSLDVAPHAACLHRSFAAQAAQRPDKVALTVAGHDYTYGALDCAANRLAHRLQQSGVGPGQRVGVLGDRGYGQVLGLLAILKAGGTYVPLDPTYPDDRLTLIQSDAALACVVGTQSALADMPLSGAMAIASDDRDLSTMPAIAPPDTATPDDPAYVLYTSGSTGTPKGVIVTHRNVARLFAAAADYIMPRQDDVWSLFHSLAFDFSVWEVWGAFLHGGRLVSVDAATARAPDRFLDLIDREGVTILNQVPSAFYALVAADLARPQSNRPLRAIIFGGEALDPSRLSGWVRRYGDDAPALINMYGITETTVHVTAHRVTETDTGSPTSVIGHPLSDLTVHLMDRIGRPIPDGLPGEMWIGGAGVSDGYLNRPHLTRERFVPAPWDTAQTLYRSGDLARRRRDGRLVFLGRADAQIKLRGYRIEPGEIESVLTADETVAEAAVRVCAPPDQPDRPLLTAYLVPQPGATIEVDQTRRRAAERLPAHMVPQAFVTLSHLPRTPSDKLDRARLPALEAMEDAKTAYEPPRTDAERAVCQAFEQVLGTDQVSRDAPFFTLGGDSIRSIRVLAALSDQGYRLPLETLFRLQTPAALGPELQTQSTQAPVAHAHRPFEGLSDRDRQRLQTDPPFPLADAYPATALQVGMLFHGAIDDLGATFRDIFAFKVTARFDATAFETALTGVVSAHAVLRTGFDTGLYDQPLQMVAQRVATPLIVDAPVPSRSVDDLIAAERSTQFDIRHPPLIRFRAIPHLGGHGFDMTVCFHHAILDGWSVASLLTEFLERYAAAAAGQSWQPPLPLPPPFARYVLDWENPARDDKAAEDYWQRRLAHHEGSTLPRPLTRLQPTIDPDDPATPDITDAIRTHEYPVPSEVTAGLDQLASAWAMPVSALALAAYLRVIGPVCGDTDVIIGVTRHGRSDIAGSDRTLGLFLAVQPLRIDLTAAESWADLCRLVFETDQQDQVHRRYPLTEILRAVGQRRLFEAAFNPIDYHVLERLTPSHGITIADRKAFEQTDLPLILHLVREAGRLSLVLTHRLETVSHSVADRIVKTLTRALTALVETPDAPHSQFALLPPEEAAVAWYGRTASYPNTETLDGLFTAVAKANPDSVALQGADGTQVTYRVLSARTDKVAALLQRAGVGPGDRVAILLPRGLDQITACLSTLKAGGVYVPIDPELADSRQQFMLEDCQAVAAIVPENAALSVPLPRICPSAFAWQDGLPVAGPTPVDRSSTDPAYIIYTSGTTGQPKGVVCHHRGVARLVRAGGACQLPAGARVLHANTPLFDITKVEIWGALLNGGTVVVLPAGRPDLQTFPAQVADGKVSVLNFATGLFHLIVDECPEALATPELIIVGGEALSADHAERALKVMRPDAVLLNGYGPTENAVFTTVHPVTRSDVAAGDIPIGQPVACTSVHIVDPFGHPVPAGVPGELLTGGDGVALGYHARPELTAARFPDNPFSLSAGLDPRPLYRTGDLVMADERGVIRFLGRRDHQIKLRGFRVELDDITQNLRRLPAIADGLVVLEETATTRRLVAYYVPIAGADGAWPSVRQALADQLPDYMVPEVGVPLPSMPLSAVGKIDRTALPAPSEGADGPRHMPQSEAQRTAHAVWAEVLGTDAFGIDDDLYALGGDSLYATQVAARLSRRVGAEVTVGTVMRARTISDLADALDALTLATTPDDALADILTDLDLDGLTDLDDGTAPAEQAKAHPQ